MTNDERDRTAADPEWLINQIAHALRNPIFAASVQSESLLLRAGDPAAVTRAAEALRGQLDRLARSIDEMLLFGRPIRAAAATVGIAELLESIAAGYRAGAREAPADVTVVEVDPTLEGRWDKDAVQVILERLLDNAVQHTQPPHAVRLSARRTGAGDIEVAVADDGDGIAPELLERATLPFFPQHSGRPGLGLAIADKFARFLGGRLEIESRVGEGTVARCVLPRSIDGAPV
jgi:signal transduction histidine kinase